MLDAHGRGDLLRLRTSGTSGGPRCVVRTADSWFASFPHVTRLLGLGAGSRLWLPGPLSATMNLFAAVHAAAVGATVSTSPAGATHTVLTPAALSRALAQRVALSAMHVLAAGDRLSQALHDSTLRAGAAQVSHYYGAAELSFVAWGSHAEDLRAFPGVEVDCRDGQVWVRSPYVCLRYDGPDGPLARDADGFATVGDRGHLDEGRLHVLGRGETAVVTAGATVLIGDVEAALEQAVRHPLAVLGLPHADLGEVLCGVVTDSDDIPALRTRAREVLDPTHRPRRWFSVDALPLTSAGKLDRARLRSMVMASQDAR